MLLPDLDVKEVHKKKLCHPRMRTRDIVFGTSIFLIGLLLGFFFSQVFLALCTL